MEHTECSLQAYKVTSVLNSLPHTHTHSLTAGGRVSPFGIMITPDLHGHVKDSVR